MFGGEAQQPAVRAAAAANAGAGAGCAGGAVGAKRGDAGIYLSAYSFLQAAEHLEDGTGAPIRMLKLIIPRDTADHGRRRRPQDCQRFVAALRRRTRAVQEIIFAMVDWRAAPEESTARLFGEVLPAQPALASITFHWCNFAPAHVELFASAVPTTPAAALAELRIVGSPVDRDAARAIANMVRRGGPLSTLAILPDDAGGLRAANGKIICDAVSSRTTSLRELEIQVNEVLPDTLDVAAGPSSPLLELIVRVRKPLSCEGVAGLARQLRTNTTMMRLCLRLQGGESPSTERPDLLFQPIEEVLERSNSTLEIEEVSRAKPPPAAQTRLDELLRQTRNAKCSLTMLERESQGLSPRAFALAGCRPTLLYRFLRQGDAHYLCRLVQPNQGPKKRGRPAAARLDSTAKTTSGATGSSIPAPFDGGGASSPVPAL
jgi:hypothetical protein